MKKSIKIGFISEYEIMDQRSWSGTISNLYNVLSEKYVVEPIIVNIPITGLLIKIVRKIIEIIFKHKSFIFQKLYSKKRSKKLGKLIKNKNYDFLFAPAGSSAIAYLNTKIPVIYLSDATFNLMINYYYFDISQRDLRICNEIERLALQNASHIIHSSHWTKKDAVNYYKIEPYKISVIPFGANLPDKYIKRKYTMERTINLLFVGVAWKRKGANIAIECMKYLNLNSEFKFKLNIIGLEEPAGFDVDNVNFIGFLNKNNQNEYNELLEFYQNSDIFILPTIAECAGIVFSEASEYGLPIVTYDTGGIQTYVKNGINGYRLPLSSTGNSFAEKIIEICKDHNKYINLSKQSRKEYEENLNWPQWLSTFNKEIINSRQ